MVSSIGPTDPSTRPATAPNVWLPLILCATLLVGCSMQDFGGSMGGITDIIPSDNGVAPPTDDELAEQRSERLASMMMTLQRRQFITDQDFKVGPDDELVLSVYALEKPGAEAILNRTISRNGLINMPHIGDLEVEGLAVSEIEKSVIDAYAGDYLKDPRVAVKILNYRSAPVYVTGAVKTPGVIYLKHNSSSVLEILSEVGGLSTGVGSDLLIVRNPPPRQPQTRPEDNTSDASDSPETLALTMDDTMDDAPASPQPSNHLPFFRRLFAGTSEPAIAETTSAPSDPAPMDDLIAALDDEPEEEGIEMITVDLKQLLDAGDVRQNASVLPGDVISVPPAKAEVAYVLGYVKRPGQVVIPEQGR
ncbi:MAG: polysaccharide biosynthesis/export family protein, partial [Verrucomicrobia bacterium]|nr:polysaccharide biosynthesis/export family protein [Verrucomicrobiota bacterium]